MRQERSSFSPSSNTAAENGVLRIADVADGEQHQGTSIPMSSAGAEWVSAPIARCVHAGRGDLSGPVECRQPPSGCFELGLDPDSRDVRDDLRRISPGDMLSSVAPDPRRRR